MQQRLIDQMFAQEDTYWWHVAKRRLIQTEIYKRVQNDKAKILDAGCGTGAMLKELSYRFPFVYGVDGSSKALAFCRKRGLAKIKQVEFKNKLPLRGAFFDAVVCLDVLEHVQHDDSLLNEFSRLLKEGGTLFLTVPAYPALWTYWDELLGHKRRYRKRALVRKLRRQGFTIVKSSYFYSFLLPIAVTFRLIKTITRRRGSDFVTIPLWLNDILMFLCTVERFIINLVDLPFGLSILIVAQK